MISGLQHFSYCRRQWALIHIENQWKENIRTTEGRYLHQTAHNPDKIEKRGEKMVMRGLKVSSHNLGVYGECDVVEFDRDTNGISLNDCEGTWKPYPVEYKKGISKETNADRLQLCCQAMCLEEMLCCEIPEGALFYGQTKRRERVPFTEELRKEVRENLLEMHQYYNRGYTPRVKKNAGCKECSMNELCLPELESVSSASSYIDRVMGEDG